MFGQPWIAKQSYTTRGRWQHAMIAVSQVVGDARGYPFCGLDTGGRVGLNEPKEGRSVEGGGGRVVEGGGGRVFPS